MPGAEENYQAHIEADTNQGPEAIHHTLGNGPDQSSPGNHFHYLTPVAILQPLPPAAPANEGKLITILGAPGVADVLYVCLKSATNTYSWKVVATG